MSKVIIPKVKPNGEKYFEVFAKVEIPVNESVERLNEEYASKLIKERVEMDNCLYLHEENLTVCEEFITSKFEGLVGHTVKFNNDYTNEAISGTGLRLLSSNSLEVSSEEKGTSYFVPVDQILFGYKLFEKLGVELKVGSVIKHLNSVGIVTDGEVILYKNSKLEDDCIILICKIVVLKNGKKTDEELTIRIDNIFDIKN